MKKIFLTIFLLAIPVIFLKIKSQNIDTLILGLPNYKPAIVQIQSEKTPEISKRQIPDMAFFLISTLIIAATSLIMLFGNDTALIVKALFVQPFTSLNLEEDSYFLQTLNFFNILYLADIAALIWLYIIEYNVKPPVNLFLTYIITFSAILIWSFIKKILGHISGLAFERHDLNASFQLKRLMANAFFSMIITFLLLFIVYTKDYNTVLLKIAFWLLIINYILKTFYSFEIFLKKDFSLFLLILYLCTVEILPVVILLNTAVQYFNTDLIKFIF